MTSPAKSKFLPETAGILCLKGVVCLLSFWFTTIGLAQDPSSSRLRDEFLAKQAIQKSLTDAEIVKLREKACQALDAFVERSQKAGKLEESLAGKNLTSALGSPVTIPDEPENKDLKNIWSSFMAQRQTLLKKEKDSLSNVCKPYLAELERLKQQYTREGDLEKALAVKAEARLVLLGRGGPEMKSAGELTEALTGLSCDWMVKGGNGYKAYAQFSFGKDGKIAKGGSLPWLKRWEAVSDNQVKIFHQEGSFWLFEFDFSTGEGWPPKGKKGAIDRDKRLRLRTEGIPAK